jgi:tetratricopeptide (TPR) repeat protein
MPANRAQFHFDQGLNFIQKGDYEKASTYFKEAILEEPQFHEALYNLSCCQAVIGDKDNALIYLSRAINLNMHCIDWAKEDREFESIKHDPLFLRLIHPQDEGGIPDEEMGFTPTVFPNAAEENDENHKGEDTKDDLEADLEAGPKEKESMPNLRDSKDVKENLPPCSNCGGILHSEKNTRSSPKQLASILAAGIVLCFMIYYTMFGMLGFILIAYGLYSLTRIDTVWVCNSCDSKGEAVGQPKEAMSSKPVEKLEDLKVKKK